MKEWQSLLESIWRTCLTYNLFASITILYIEPRCSIVLNICNSYCLYLSNHKIELNIPIVWIVLVLTLQEKFILPKHYEGDTSSRIIFITRSGAFKAGRTRNACRFHPRCLSKVLQEKPSDCYWVIHKRNTTFIMWQADPFSGLKWAILHSLVFTVSCYSIRVRVIYSWNANQYFWLLWFFTSLWIHYNYLKVQEC